MIPSWLSPRRGLGAPVAGVVAISSFSLETWAHADPETRPLVDSARVELAGLQSRLAAHP